MGVENHQAVEVPNGPSANLAPDHGVVILVMGILSLLFGFFGICCFVTTIFGLGLGITSILLGRANLVQMEAGTMTTNNQGLVIAGLITGAIGAFLNGLFVLLGIALVLLQPVLDVASP